MSTAQENNIQQYGGTQNASISGGPSLIAPNQSANTFFTISMGDNSAAAGDFYIFTSWNAIGSQTQYQVTSGKTFRSIGYYIIGGPSNSNNYTFGYGTASFTNGTGTPPTGVVYYGSKTNGQGGIYAMSLSTTLLWVPIPMAFPSGSYPFFQPGGANPVSIQMIGQEV